MTNEKSTTNGACKTGMCSTGLMKSGCPSCLVIGLAVLPFELLFRWVRGIISGPVGGSVIEE